jgi:methylenetetrahydrofolate reductase (NADPH)
MMPPRPSAGEKSERIFNESAAKLVALSPDFISVTYGAGGGDRINSLNAIKRIVRDTPVMPIAHLTCIATPKSQVEDVVNDFLEAGVRMFLSLRGDMPKGMKVTDLPHGDDSVRDAVELTYLLRSLDKKQQRQSHVQKFHSLVRPLIVCVAAFPEGNPEYGTSVQFEVDRLLEKQDAGADFAITQVYYDAAVFDNFVSKARRAGVTIPILAGILPTWSPARLERVEKNIKVPAPEQLVADLLQARDDNEAQELGLKFWEKISTEAINSGSPGVHMFTFNQFEAPHMLSQRLGLV